MFAGFVRMRAASVFASLTFRQWVGPTLSGPQAYVISEPVPLGWKWRLVAASILALGNGYNTRSIYLYAIPPALARAITNVNQADKGVFFAGLGSGTAANNPPLKAAFLISEGGTGPDVQEVLAPSAGSSSVNLMQT